MKIKNIMLISGAVVLASSFAFFSNSQKSSMFIKENVEALTRGELIHPSTLEHEKPVNGQQCWQQYDSPSWYRDDEFALICTVPNGEHCVVLECHDIENRWGCIVY